jgi:hypothetical protein
MGFRATDFLFINLPNSDRFQGRGWPLKTAMAQLAGNEQGQADVVRSKFADRKRAQIDVYVRATLFV